MDLFVKKITEELAELSDPEKKRILPRFFKTGKGEYGEGDRFIGVTVPKIREVAKRHADAGPESVETLLRSSWHECRMCALLMLSDTFSKSGKVRKKDIYEFYLRNSRYINNWDLTDLSAPKITGIFLRDSAHITEHVIRKLPDSCAGSYSSKYGIVPYVEQNLSFSFGREDLYVLAGSKWLWDQRIAILSTLPLIKNDDFEDIIRLSELLLNHRHDLMQKAIGWMLRETGKRDERVLTDFLERNCTRMPRTMLRYSIEKLTPEQKARYMKK
ncbi:MAG: DNA alkylation repair protein [Bacteroidales bacterium]|jgi:3-methyladenine DNA glycosylase AlkD|nr:DNA alkylation repair protein [Bacteroidales bacterium]